MSEVDNHYGATLQGRRGPAGSSRAGEEWKTGGDGRPGLRDRAAQAASETRDRVGDAYEQASEWASDAYGSVSRNAVYARRRSMVHLGRGRRQVTGFVDENPIVIGLAGLAAGILIGALLPGTRRENEVFGRYADDARQEGLRYAQAIAEQGRQAIQDNLRGVGAAVDRDTGDETFER